MAFNPFKAGVTSTTGTAAVPSNATASGHHKITSQQSEIDAIEAAREAQLEEHIEDREIQVYNQKANVANASMNTNQFLAMMEKRQAEAKQKAEQELQEIAVAAGIRDQDMSDEQAVSAQAAATQDGSDLMMINTMGTNAAAASGVMIGSSNPAFDPNSEITDEDERRGALAFLAD